MPQRIRAPIKTSGEIATAIHQIEIKKQNLHESFLQLQSQSPSSSSTLNWTELDTYFTTLTSSLHHKFHLLQTLNLPHLFCQNSDGLGLRNLIVEANNRGSILAQLPDAYRCAPDPAAMVLDAMTGFCTGKGPESRLVKNACVSMLEVLIRLQPEIRVELREKAMTVANQWNLERVKCIGKDIRLYAFGLLLFVEAYGLIDQFSMESLIDCFAIIAKRSEAISMCRKIMPANKINDMIQAFINKGLQIDAVKFIIQFRKINEFPVVNILKERKEMCMRNVEESRMKGKNHQNAVIIQEVTVLKSIIKCIGEYGLELEFPKGDLVEIVEKLENDPVCIERQAQDKEKKTSSLNRK